jgi:hypothetical protein
MLDKCNNRVINALWIGNNLSQLEMLCIHSFLKNGHSFVLWAYDKIENNLPEGVVVKDASEIIPREKVFCYKHTNQFGHGKGSYAGFSDIFRYKLLYEQGGWWTDMDVTCLKHFDFEEPYIFRSHHDFPVVGNIMKCPKGSELMKCCYETAASQINENNTNWHLPIQILNDNLKKLELSKYIRTISNQDSWNIIRKMLIKDIAIPPEWCAIHWVNEEWRRNNVNKNRFYRKSTMGKVCRDYIPEGEKLLIDFNISERFRFTFFSSAMKQMKGRLFR